MTMKSILIFMPFLVLVSADTLYVDQSFEHVNNYFDLWHSRVIQQQSNWVDDWLFYLGPFSLPREQSLSKILLNMTKLVLEEDDLSKKNRTPIIEDKECVVRSQLALMRAFLKASSDYDQCLYDVQIKLRDLYTRLYERLFMLKCEILVKKCRIIESFKELNRKSNVTQSTLNVSYVRVKILEELETIDSAAHKIKLGYQSTTCNIVAQMQLQQYFNIGKRKIWTCYDPVKREGVVEYTKPNITLQLPKSMPEPTELFGSTPRINLDLVSKNRTEVPAACLRKNICNARN